MSFYFPFRDEKLPATLHDVEEATAYAFSYMMDLKASHKFFVEFFFYAFSFYFASLMVGLELWLLKLAVFSDLELP